MRYRYYKGANSWRHCWNTKAEVAGNPSKQFLYWCQSSKGGTKYSVKYFQRRLDAKYWAFYKATKDHGPEWGLQCLPSDTALRHQALMFISKWLRDDHRDADAALAEMQMGAVKVKLNEQKAAAKAAAEAAKPDIRQVKIKRTRELVKKWSTRFKLAQNKLKKLQARLKRLERITP